jgi:hypothetical protein
LAKWIDFICLSGFLGNPYGTELTYRAASKVFNWLGAEGQVFISEMVAMPRKKKIGQHFLILLIGSSLARKQIEALGS